MIVKYVNSVGEWGYIDGIHYVKVGDAGNCKQGEIIPIFETVDSRKSSDERLFAINMAIGDKVKAIITSEAAYLLNDKGQTIERLV
ncbi:MAG: hypothetical protein WC365_07360 [Candidatus Babeliales bacterium]|jgi:hypothetical protein